MRPAFSSTKSAAAFALLLLVLLSLPVVVGKNLLPPREQIYSIQGWGNGPYPWIRHEIFEETNDIDIAIMGSSHILQALNTPYLQARLGEKLGRPAVVRTIAWGGAGYDALFFIAQDLLEHRHVRMLVFYDENPDADLRNALLFRFGDNGDSLAGLPLNDKGLYYFAAVIGMPRNLLCLFRPNLPAPLVSNPPNYWEQHYASGSVVKLLGCTSSELGFNYDAMSDNFSAFTPFAPRTAATPADVEIFSATQKNDFEFAGDPLPVWQVQFARRLTELARTNGCGLVMLHIPVLADAPQKAIRERAFWPEIFESQVTLIGIPPAKLFAGLTDQELHWLFTNRSHLNKNGMEFFTSIVTPILIKLYETTAKP
jgi:hypothetical protein